jgi:6-phosphogluconate dehydrogenase (decarboxylating)
MRGKKRENAMQVAMIGLGRMGANMVRRLIGGNYECEVFDHDKEVIAARNPCAMPGPIHQERLCPNMPRAVHVQNKQTNCCGNLATHGFL